MVLGAPVGYTLEESIGVFIGLSLGNPFGTLEISFTGVSPGKMGDLMIDTKEVSLVVLSMGIPIVSLLKFQNCGDVMPGTLLGDPLGLWFGSEAVRYWCSCRRLTDFSEDTCGRGGISCIPSSGAVITYNMNSVIFFQLLELITLALSPIFLSLIKEGGEELIYLSPLDTRPSHWTWMMSCIY